MEADIGKFVLNSFDRIKDYPVYANWWRSDGENPPKIKDLPANGFSVYKGSRLVGCSFLALTDCDFSVMCL